MARKYTTDKEDPKRSSNSRNSKPNNNRRSQGKKSEF